MRFLRQLGNEGGAPIVPRELYSLTDAGGGFFLADHPAVFELDDAVAEGGVALRVRDLNDRGAGVVEAFEELHDFVALRGVEIAGGLVSEDQLRILNHRARYAHELLLSAGKLVGEEVFLADDVEAIEDVADEADALLVRNIFIRKRDFEILENGEIVDQVIALENEADVRFVQLVAFLDVEFVDRLIVEVVFAAPRAVEHADDAEQSGFSRAGRTHEGDEFALLNVQRDAAQHKKLAAASLENLLEISQLNQRFHKISLSLKWTCSSVPAIQASLYVIGGWVGQFPVSALGRSRPETDLPSHR